VSRRGRRDSDVTGGRSYIASAMQQRSRSLISCGLAEGSTSEFGKACRGLEACREKSLKQHGAGQIVARRRGLLCPSKPKTGLPGTPACGPRSSRAFKVLHSRGRGCARWSKLTLKLLYTLLAFELETAAQAGVPVPQNPPTENHPRNIPRATGF
jgi:hypothetical protein